MSEVSGKTSTILSTSVLGALRKFNSLMIREFMRKKSEFTSNRELSVLLVSEMSAFNLTIKS